ncbi:MAG TPA: 3-oxoacyl-ACP reductase family protein [Nitrospinota bacterium]|nr:3-oxoacyl-ACP reductase family protein [Nitrospinota bacterium]
MEKNLLNKVSIITGASTGIGRATALALAKRGSHVVINFLKSKKEALDVGEKVESLGIKSLVIQGDVGIERDVKDMVKETIEEFGRIDILVNNAGSPIQRSKFLDCKEELWDQVMSVNLKGTFLCSKEVLKIMVKQKSGKIINISSIASFHGSAGESVHYAAAKGGVNSLTIGLAKEFAPYGITVNAIAPGLIDTPFHDKFSTPERLERIISKIPLKRIGTPGEIAEVVAFLASDGANYITGEIIRVSGGR